MIHLALMILEASQYCQMYLQNVMLSTRNITNIDWKLYKEMRVMKRT